MRPTMRCSLHGDGCSDRSRPRRPRSGPEGPAGCFPSGAVFYQGQTQTQASVRSRRAPPFPMRLIDGYLFRQLLGPALLAAAALCGIAMLSESLSALDVLADQRRGLLVFAKIILLAMPQLVAMILPVAVLVGALVAMNRLHTENEIVICFNGGMNRCRGGYPPFHLARAVSLGCLVRTPWI